MTDADTARPLSSWWSRGKVWHRSSFSLQLPAADLVGLQTRQPNLEGAGEVRLRRLVREALRMRPQRIIVGEVRHEECLDLLLALNCGIPGMCTVHANSAREAIGKVCTPSLR